MLTVEQTELVKLVQELKPDQVQRVLEFTRRLQGTLMNYSDDWSEEDMRDATNMSMRRMDEEDPYDWPGSEETPK